MKGGKTISSIRMSEELAKKVELVAKREGISKAELVRRPWSSMYRNSWMQSPRAPRTF